MQRNGCPETTKEVDAAERRQVSVPTSMSARAGVVTARPISAAASNANFLMILPFYKLERQSDRTGLRLKCGSRARCAYLLCGSRPPTQAAQPLHRPRENITNAGARPGESLGQPRLLRGNLIRPLRPWIG